MWVRTRLPACHFRGRATGWQPIPRDIFTRQSLCGCDLPPTRRPTAIAVKRGLLAEQFGITKIGVVAHVPIARVPHHQFQCLGAGHVDVHQASWILCGHQA